MLDPPYIWLALSLLLGVGLGPAAASQKPLAPRKVLSLDGMWQVEQGQMDQTPPAFSHTVPVPGLVDMARPAFQEVGRKSALRAAFWYRRTFTVDGPVPEVALLKIHKARYGTKVFLNGTVVGEHLPCFTPAYLDLKPHLKGDGQQNELLVRVGANRECIPADTPSGWDFEKYLYIPGIYDSVELILTGTPYIVNVQTVPELVAKQVRIVAEVQAASQPCSVALSGEVAEARSAKVVTTKPAPTVSIAGGQQAKVDFRIPIADCRLWSPDDPFLYELRLKTGGDGLSTRFGMRSFRFDPKLRRAMLNDKVFFLRGSNVCIYRFFEDEARGDLPWRADWVRRLHQKFKWMHWDALRYCIGFPPEFWYDIADEEGFLIQDEFPIWLLGKAPEDPKAEKIIPQYTEWMRERWNHPCVVIWDAQNESFTEESGKALQAVRKLDLSNRPWDNGWREPQSPTDAVETHPYLFIRGWSGKPFFHFNEIAEVSARPQFTKYQQGLDPPIIINEYGWLWLNRDGTPTCLTDKVFESLLGPNSTTQQRRDLYARYLAAKTEFWRCHRQCAGVLHFCGLGYSRAGDKPRPEGGATSDHFLDVAQLTLEPLFAQYVRDAFNPVGLMLDFWDEELTPGGQRALKVFVINDRYRPWEGDVKLQLLRAGQPVAQQSQPCKVDALGRQVLSFTQAMPSQPGEYALAAELPDLDGKTIRSFRQFKIRPVSAQPGQRGQWRPLFDGKKLDGWSVRGGFATYKASDGMIVGRTAEGSPNSFLCTGDFGDFELEFDVLCDTALNSGVQIRSHIYQEDTPQPSNPKNLRKAGTVYGYQCEIATEEGGNCGNFWDEARWTRWWDDFSKKPDARRAFKNDQWNHYRVVAQGDRIRSWINGIPCADFRDSTDSHGFIGLQVHGIKKGTGPYQVRWRNLKIRELQPGEKVGE